MANDYRYVDRGVCQGQTQPGGPDTVFQVEAPAGGRLRVTTTATWDAVVNLITLPATNCGTVLPDAGLTGIQCLRSVDSTTTGVETMIFPNYGTTAQSFFLTIDGQTSASSGAFDMSVTFTPFAQGDVCANPTPVAPTQTVTNQAIDGFPADYSLGNGCAYTTSINSFRDRVYSVSVPAGQRLTATVTPELGADGGVSFNPNLNLVTGPCNTAPLSLACDVGSEGAARGASEMVRFDNTSMSAREVLLVVATVDPNASGTFTLDVSSTPMTFPPGETCGSAPPLISSSTVLPAESLAGYASHYDFSGATQCLYGPGPDRAYEIDLAPGQIMRAVATPAPGDGGVDVSLVLLDSNVPCGPGPCLATADQVDPLGAEVISYVSPDGGARRMQLVVDTFTGAPAGTYSLDISLGPAVGDTCATAAPAITGTTTLLHQSFIGYASDFLSSGATCAFGSGADRTYRIDLPPMTRLSAGVGYPGTSIPTGNMLLSLIDGPASNCTASPTCLASSDITARVDFIGFNNTSASPRTVFLVVDRGPATWPLNATFKLKTVYGTPADDVCASATVISGTTTLSNQTTIGYTNNYAPTTASNCATGMAQPGLDRAYQVTLATGQTLDVTVDPGPDDDASVYVVASCAAAPGSCLAGSDISPWGNPETVTYTNTLAVPRTVFIVVDSTFTRPVFDYTLSVVVR